MAQIFPKWIDRIPPLIGLCLILGLVCIAGFFSYFGSPKYTDVGYGPIQPVKYSHKVHAGDLGIDCRYCHVSVETSAKANIPPTQTCMNCHTLVGADKETLDPVRESWASGRPIEWIRVHKLAEYSYFDHSAHINAGVGCESCHGNVAQMEVVMQVEPLSMGWCLDCHRNPDRHLRPLDRVTEMGWEPPANQSEIAAHYTIERSINPSEDCSVCHR